MTAAWLNYQYLIDNSILQPDNVLVYASICTLDELQIDRICRNIGVKIKRNPHRLVLATVGTNFISVNPDLTGEARDQVIATGLGCLLHQEYGDITSTSNWAEELLIPTHMLLSRSAACGRDPRILGKMFRVSTARMQSRINQEILMY